MKDAIQITERLRLLRAEHQCMIFVVDSAAGSAVGTRERYGTPQKTIELLERCRDGRWFAKIIDDSENTE